MADDNNKDRDFLWGTLKFAGKCTAVVAGVAFLGNDIGDAFKSIGGHEPGTWQSVCDTAGNVFSGASGIAASSLAGAVNLLTDPFLATDPDVASKAHAALAAAAPGSEAAATAKDALNAISYREVTAKDVQSLFADKVVDKITESIAGGTYKPDGTLIPDKSIVPVGADYTPRGLLNIVSEGFTAARDSSAGQLVVNHPLQATGIAVLGGAAAELAGRKVSQVAHDGAVNVNIGPQRA